MACSLGVLQRQASCSMEGTCLFRGARSQTSPGTFLLDAQQRHHCACLVPWRPWSQDGGDPDPMPCAPRGAMDTSQEQVSGSGGRVVALGPVLALVLCPWPGSCLVPVHKEAGRVWAEWGRLVLSSRPFRGRVFSRMHLKASSVKAGAGGSLSSPIKARRCPKVYLLPASPPRSVSRQIQVTTERLGGGGWPLLSGSGGFPRQTAPQKEGLSFFSLSSRGWGWGVRHAGNPFSPPGGTSQPGSPR